MIQGSWSAGAKALALTADGVPWTGEALSLTLTEDLNGGGDVALGSTCAAVLRLTLAGESGDWGGRRLTAALGGVPLGTFTVVSAEAREGRTELEAMDDLGTAFEDACVPAAESGTALGVIRAVCAAAGVALGDVSGVTDVPVTGLSPGHTRREMIGLMAALLGRNAHMDRAGRLALRWYGNSGVSLTGDDIYPGELTMADRDYTVGRLECAVTRTAAAEDGDGTVTEDTETTVYAAGTGTMGISLTDEYMTQAILDGVFQDIGGLTYRPMTVTFYGDARIEAGDILSVTDGAGATHAVPAMKVVHAWDGGVRTTVTAAGNPAEGLSRSPAGYLSKSVSNLMAEFARFKTLEAENLRALKASFGTVILDTLEAEGVSADWINAGELLAEYLRLYGYMGVYKDRTLATLGGKMGYTEALENLATGSAMVMTSEGERGGAVVGENGLVFGYMPAAQLSADDPLLYGRRKYGNQIELTDNLALNVDEISLAPARADRAPVLRITGTGGGTPSQITKAKVDAWDGAAACRAVTVTAAQASGVTLDTLRVYRAGKIGLVYLEFTLTGPLSAWTAAATGLPGAAAYWFATAHSWGSSWVRPCRVDVNPAGALNIRYGAAGTYEACFAYPIG